MTFTEAIKDGFDHYVKFDGRARRSTFWFWILFAFLVGIAANIIDAIVGTSYVVSSLVSLGLFLPGLSVAIRRLHDTGRSGWWYLIIFIPLIGIIVLIVWWATEGDAGDNEYGPPAPTAPGTAAAAPPPAV